jgi:membrane fusion protein (multidrug efflux system)
MEEQSGKKRAVRIAAVVLPILVIAGIAMILHGRHYESTDDAFIEAHVIPISARVSGQVLAVYVNDNQTVEKDQLLVEIDPADYGVKRTEQRAKLMAAEAAAKRSALDVARYEDLFQHDAITRQQLDNALAQSASENAEVAQERAVVKQSELNFSYTQIRASERGRITRKSVEVGSYLQIGQTLLSLVPPDVWVTANFKETQLTFMHAGQTVKINADAYPDHEFTGHVDSIQSGTGARFSLLPPENATGNYVKVVQRVPVKILIDATDPRYVLAPGMSVVPTVRVR